MMTGYVLLLWMCGNVLIRQYCLLKVSRDASQRCTQEDFGVQQILLMKVDESHYETLLVLV
jgi:hypothetical protein